MTVGSAARAVALWPVVATGRLIEAVLRRRLGVFEYTQDPSCILRASLTSVRRSNVPADGLVLGRGDPLVEIHLWNERMQGRTVGLRLASDLRRSLQELAAYLEHMDPEGRYRVVHGVIGMVGGRDVGRLSAIMARFGFTVGKPLPVGRRPWQARFWEGFYARWLLFSFNPRASSRQRLGDLARFEIWLSRDVLRERYGLIDVGPRMG